MARPGRVEFLERKSYRQRRFRDAVRMLPVFGVVLMILPMMWSRDVDGQGLTSTGMLYLFGVWLALVAVAAVLSRVLTDWAEPSDGPQTPGENET